MFRLPDRTNRCRRAPLSRAPALRALLAAVSLLPGLSSAQSSADVKNAERQAEIFQQRRQEQLQRDRDEYLRPERPSGADLQVQTPTSDGLQTQVCHAIAKVDIRNATRLSPAAYSDIHERFEGRCLGTREISAIIGLITKSYIEQGYVTARAYLPEQDLTGGSLRIDVVEGRIERYQIDRESGARVYLRGAFPGATGDILNLRDLEQGIDQLNRLQSNNASMQILPGTKTGDSVVEVINQRSKPWHLFLSYDNQGAKSTGREQISVSAVVDSLLGLNEMLSLTWRQSSPNQSREHRSEMQAIGLAVPWGYNTFGIDLNQSSYYNAIQLPSGIALPATGTGNGGSVYWARLLTRDHVSRLTLTQMLGVKTAHNYFASQYLDVSSRTLSFADFKLSYTRNLPRGYLSVDLDHIRGLGVLGAMHDQAGLPMDQPHAQFVKNTADIRLSVPFELADSRFSFESQLFMQRAEKALYGSEQLLLGSLYSVRGFSRNTLSGDHGYYWRNTLAKAWSVEIGGTSVNGRSYLSLDRGSVHSYNPDLSRGAITGAAIGMQFGVSGLAIDMTYARPVALSGDMQREPAQFWFRLSTGI